MLFFLLISCNRDPSESLYNPDLDPSLFGVIKLAIYSAAEGDVVTIPPGTYNENIEFMGKSITLKSEAGPEHTIIDGGDGTVVSFVSGEDENTILDGFTIKNGSSGIYCLNSSPTIMNSIIIENGFQQPTGGGIQVGTDAHPKLINLLIIDNNADKKGGGVYGGPGSGADIVNCTITGNSAGESGGAVCGYQMTALSLMNTIIWDNEAPEGPGIHIDSDTSPVVACSDVQGGWPGIGNIDLDPRFIDTANKDYHLRQEPCQLDDGSPCVDAGCPPSVSGSTRTDGVQDTGNVDMGFHYLIGGNPIVSNVTAKQIKDATRMVEVLYDLTGEEEHTFYVSMKISQDGGETFPSMAEQVFGDIGPGQQPGEQNKIYWNPAVDLPGIGGEQFVARIFIQGTVYADSAEFKIDPAKPGSLSGTVYDESGSPLAGAEVTVSHHSSKKTGQDGCFLFETVDAGFITIEVIKKGFYPYKKEHVVCEASLLEVPISLIMDTGEFRIVKVESRWTPAVNHSKNGKATYYLKEVNHEEKFTATVDWGERKPGHLRWETPEKTFVDKCPGDKISRSFRLGTSNDIKHESPFSDGGVLRVVAISGDDPPVESNSSEANFRVVPSPLGALGSLALYIPPLTNTLNYTSYSLAFGSPKEVEAGTEKGKVPKEIPAFGGKAFKFISRFDASAQFSGDGQGKAQVMIPLETDELKPFPIAGKKLLPEIGISVGGGADWDYEETRGDWNLEGFVKFGADISIDVPPEPQYAIWPPIPIPFYIRGKIAVELAAVPSLVAWTLIGPMMLGGKVELNPELEVAVGAGVADVAAIEVAVAGGAELELECPALQPLERLTIYAVGKARAYFYFAQFEIKSKKFKYDIFGEEARWEVVDSIVTIIPRDYIDAQIPYGLFVANSPEYIVNHGRNTTETTIELNVFKQSTPDLATYNDDLILVWLHDDPLRTLVNRTVLHFSSFKASTGTWSKPEAVIDDGTADFHPQVSMLPNGDAIVVWENVNEVLDEPQDPHNQAEVEAKFMEMKSKTEVVAAYFSAQNGTWSPKVLHKVNAAFDRSPRIVSAPNGTAMITWVTNDTLHNMGTSNQPNDLYYSVFDGNQFQTPALVASGVPSVLKSEMAFNGKEAVLLVCSDTDDDYDTPEDRELYAVQFQGGAWGPLQKLMSDMNEDHNPQVAYDMNGKLNLFWYSDGGIMQDQDLDLSNAVCIMDAEVEASSGIADFRLTSGPSNRLGLVWQEASEDLVDIWYAVHIPNTEPGKQAWSEERVLTMDGSMEYALSTAFNASGELVVAYNKAEIGYETETVEVGGELYEINNLPAPGQVDLNVLWHTCLGDLAVHAEGIKLDPPNPLPGETATISAVIKNLGDKAAKDFHVLFYDEGTFVGATSVIETLPGGLETEVSIDWEVPHSVYPRDLSVLIDPVGNDDDPANNNGVFQDVMKPDLAIESIQVRRVGTHALLTMRVHNKGVFAIEANSTHVTLHRDNPEGTVIASLPITHKLVPGAFQDLHHKWNMDGMLEGRSSTKVYTVTDEADLVDEFNEDNNEHSATVWH